MKTKILFTSMVLPTLFAACTAEEFAENQNVSAGLEGRALLDPITVTIENGKPDSRFSWNEEKYEWNQFTAEDKFSAGLVDNINKVIGDDVLTNYIFSSEDGKSYSTTTQMVEGAYMFYSYTGFETSASRGPVKFDLTSQDQIDLNNPAATVEENKFFIAPLYRLDSKTANNNLGLEFVSYWSTAAIKIANASGKEFKIVRMALVDTNTEKSFAVKGEISPVTIAGGAVVDNQNKFIYSYDEEKGEYVLPKDVNIEDFRTADLYNTSKTTKVNELVVDCQSYVLEAGKDATAYIQVPAGKYDGLAVQVVVEVADAKGVVSTLTLTKEVVLNGKSSNTVASNDRTKFSRGKATAVFGLTEENTPAAYEIDELELLGGTETDGLYASSYDDMYEYLTTVNVESDKSMQINNFGSLKLDDKLITLINRAGKQVEFVNPIEIATESPKTVEITNIAFGKDVTLSKGSVKLGANVYTGIVENGFGVANRPVQNITFTVNEGATLALTDGDYTLATIVNNGILDFAGNNNVTVSTVKNGEKSKVVVSNVQSLSSDYVKGEFNLPAVLEVLKGATLHINNINDLTKSIINKGTITFWEDSRTINNKGVIDNYGVINFGGDYSSTTFNNVGPDNDNIATINNYGIIASLTVGNNSVVNMMNNTASISVKAAAEATGYVDNTEGGFVTNDSTNPATVQAVYSGNQSGILGQVPACNKIVYSNGTWSSVSTVANTIKEIVLSNVITSGDATINAKNVTIKGGEIKANISFPEATAMTFAGVTFNGTVTATAATENTPSKAITIDKVNGFPVRTVFNKTVITYASNENKTKLATLTVNQGAELEVKFGATVGDAGTTAVTNNGKVFNYGTIKGSNQNGQGTGWSGESVVID